MHRCLSRLLICAILAAPLASHAAVASLAEIQAQPFAPPTEADRGRLTQEILELTNAARAQPRTCGRESFATTTPLRLNARLTAAARDYADVLAATSHFDHTGPDGSRPGTRVGRVGYVYSMVAENLAAGPTTAQDTVNGWLNSPGHCANLMRPGMSEMGIAYAVNPNSEKGIYWVQLFGQPR